MVNGLKLLQRQQQANGIKGADVFTTLIKPLGDGQVVPQFSRAAIDWLRGRAG